MTSHEPPVYMDEDDDRSCFHSHMNTAVEEASVSYIYCICILLLLLSHPSRVRLCATPHLSLYYTDQNAKWEHQDFLFIPILQIMLLSFLLN